MNRDLMLSIGLVVGVGLAFLVVFFILRAVGEALFGWMFRKKDPLIAESLSTHLAALRKPRTVSDEFDVWFNRIVGRSELAMSAAQASAYLLLCGVVVGSGVYLWRSQIELAAGAGLVGMAALLVYFWLMHWRWQRQLQDQLPDAFHFLARSLRAGLTLDQSVALIGRQGQQPIAREFQRCTEHLELGMTVPAAFEMTGQRIGLTDFNLLVSVVTMHRQTGGNLALLVDRLATMVRSRNQFRGQVAAVTALGRLSGMFIALAAPAFMLFYWLVNPEYLTRLTESPQGLTVLFTAITLEVVGVTWLLWLLRVDY